MLRNGVFSQKVTQLLSQSFWSPGAQSVEHKQRPLGFPMSAAITPQARRQLEEAGKQEGQWQEEPPPACVFQHSRAIN